MTLVKPKKIDIPTNNHKIESEGDVSKIINSEHPRKVIVAGPGTGKSYLFQELIKNERVKGKKDFVASTFIGKLGDALADDLCGMAKTFTMHSFARKLFLDNYEENHSGLKERAKRVWNEIVGEEFSEITFLREISSRKVDIEVVGSAALAELKQFYGKQFVQQLKKKKIVDVEKIVFHLADY